MTRLYTYTKFSQNSFKTFGAIVFTDTVAL